MSQRAAPSSRFSDHACPESITCLNNCLASYVEEVHKLKKDKVHLSAELESLKQECDRLISDWRKREQEAEKKSIEYQLNYRESVSHNKDLESEIRELKRELEAKNKAEEDLASARSQIERLEAKNTRFRQEVDNLKSEIHGLKKDKRTLAEKNAELENNKKLLTDELACKKAAYEKEIEMLKTTESPFPEPDDILDKARKAITSSHRAAMEKKYKDKISTLERKNTDLSATITRLSTDIQKLKSDTAEIPILRNKIQRYEDQLKSRDMELECATQRYTTELAQREEKLCKLQKEYHDLMDKKVNLDNEIEIYKTILLREESRLGIKLVPCRGHKRPLGFDDPQDDPNNGKRPCPEPQGVERSLVQINDVDRAGRFIEIKSMSPQSKRLGGYRIVHEVEGKESLTYTFHHTVKLQANGSIKVWGYEAEGVVPKNSTTDKIFREEPTWGAGNNAITKLVTPKDEVVATFIQSTSDTSSEDSSMADDESDKVPRVDKEDNTEVIHPEKTCIIS